MLRLAQLSLDTDASSDTILLTGELSFTAPSQQPAGIALCFNPTCTKINAALSGNGESSSGATVVDEQTTVLLPHDACHGVAFSQQEQHGVVRSLVPITMQKATGGGDTMVVTFTTRLDFNTCVELRPLTSRWHGCHRVITSPVGIATTAFLPLVGTATTTGQFLDSFELLDDVDVNVSVSPTSEPTGLLMLDQNAVQVDPRSGSCVILLRRNELPFATSTRIPIVELPNDPEAQHRQCLRVRCFRGHGGGPGVERGLHRFVALIAMLRNSPLLKRNLQTDVMVNVHVFGEAPGVAFGKNKEVFSLARTIVVDSQLFVAAGASGGPAALGAHAAVANTVQLLGPIVDIWLKECAPSVSTTASIPFKAIARCILLQTLCTLRMEAGQGEHQVKKNGRDATTPITPLLSHDVLQQFLETEGYNLANETPPQMATENKVNETHHHHHIRIATLQLWKFIESHLHAIVGGGSGDMVATRTVSFEGLPSQHHGVRGSFWRGFGSKKRGRYGAAANRDDARHDPEAAGAVVDWLVQRFLALPCHTAAPKQRSAEAVFETWFAALAVGVGNESSQQQHVPNTKLGVSVSQHQGQSVISLHPHLLPLQTAHTNDPTPQGGEQRPPVEIEMSIENFFYEQRREQIATLLFRFKKLKKGSDDVSGHVPCSVAIFECSHQQTMSSGSGGEAPAAHLITVLHQAVLLPNGQWRNNELVVEMSFYLKVGGGEILRTAEENTSNSNGNGESGFMNVPPKFAAVLLPLDDQQHDEQHQLTNGVNRFNTNNTSSSSKKAATFVVKHRDDIAVKAAAQWMCWVLVGENTGQQRHRDESLPERLLVGIGGAKMAAHAPEEALLLARHFSQNQERGGNRTITIALSETIETMLRAVLHVTLASEVNEHERPSTLLSEFRPLVEKHRSLAVQLGRAQSALGKNAARATSSVWASWIESGWEGPISKEAGVGNGAGNGAKGVNGNQYVKDKDDDEAFTVLNRHVLFPNCSNSTQSSGAAGGAAPPKRTLRLRPGTPKDSAATPMSSGGALPTTVMTANPPPSLSTSEKEAILASAPIHQLLATAKAGTRHATTSTTGKPSSSPTESSIANLLKQLQ